jgi:tetratricopeptide (TPR) repeat protein
MRSRFTFIPAESSLEKAMIFNRRPKSVNRNADTAPQSVTVERCCDQGKAHCEAGEFAQALIAFDQAIALAPKHCQAHNHRGNVLCQLNRYAEALAAYDRATALSPSYHPAWFNRGQLLTEMGAYGNALESYDQAIRFEADPIYLHAREDIWLKQKLVKA